MTTPAVLLRTSDGAIASTEVADLPQSGASPWNPGPNEGTNTTLDIGRMFNLPNDVVAMIATTQGGACPVAFNLSYWIRDPGTGDTLFGPVPCQLPAVAEVNFSALADFTGDGYAELVTSVGAGELLVASATDVDDFSAGLTWGPPLTVPQVLAMTTGDFDGNGIADIAAAYFAPGTNPLDLYVGFYTRRWPSNPPARSTCRTSSSAVSASSSPVPPTSAPWR